MYIGNRSALRLQLFIQGWIYGREVVPDADILQRFSVWIASRYRITSNHSWADIITFFAEGSVESFEEFYELFDEFLASRR
jgi:hypothetical protein